MVSINGSFASLLTDPADNLFGTSFEGGANGEGTVFEITNSGLVTTAPATPASDGILFRTPTGRPRSGE